MDDALKELQKLFQEEKTQSSPDPLENIQKLISKDNKKVKTSILSIQIYRRDSSGKHIYLYKNKKCNKVKTVKASSLSSGNPAVNEREKSVMIL